MEDSYFSTNNKLNMSGEDSDEGSVDLTSDDNSWMLDAALLQSKAYSNIQWSPDDVQNVIKRALTEFGLPESDIAKLDSLDWPQQDPQQHDNYIKILTGLHEIFRDVDMANFPNVATTIRDPNERENNLLKGWWSDMSQNTYHIDMSRYNNQGSQARQGDPPAKPVVEKPQVVKDADQPVEEQKSQARITFKEDLGERFQDDMLHMFDTKLANILYKQNEEYAQRKMFEIYARYYIEHENKKPSELYKEPVGRIHAKMGKQKRPFFTNKLNPNFDETAKKNIAKWIHNQRGPPGPAANIWKHVLDTYDEWKTRPSITMQNWTKMYEHEKKEIPVQPRGRPVVRGKRKSKRKVRIEEPPARERRFGSPVRSKKVTWAQIMKFAGDGSKFPKLNKNYTDDARKNFQSLKGYVNGLGVDDEYNEKGSFREYVQYELKRKNPFAQYNTYRNVFFHLRIANNLMGRPIWYPEVPENKKLEGVLRDLQKLMFNAFKFDGNNDFQDYRYGTNVGGNNPDEINFGNKYPKFFHHAGQDRQKRFPPPQQTYPELPGPELESEKLTNQERKDMRKYQSWEYSKLQETYENAQQDLKFMSTQPEQIEATQKAIDLMRRVLDQKKRGTTFRKVRDKASEQIRLSPKRKQSPPTSEDILKTKDVDDLAKLVASKPEHPTTPPRQRYARYDHDLRKRLHKSRVQPDHGPAKDTPRKRASTSALQKSGSRQEHDLGKIVFGDRRKYYDSYVEGRFDNARFRAKIQQGYTKYFGFPDSAATMQAYSKKDILLPDNEAGFMTTLGQLNETDLENVKESTNDDPKLWAAKKTYAKELLVLGLTGIVYQPHKGYLKGNYDSKDDIPVDFRSLVKGTGDQYHVPSLPVWRDIHQFKEHLEVGLQYREELKDYYGARAPGGPKALFLKPKEQAEFEKRKNNVSDDIHSFEKTLQKVDEILRRPKAENWKLEQPQEPEPAGFFSRIMGASIGRLGRMFSPKKDTGDEKSPDKPDKPPDKPDDQPERTPKNVILQRGPGIDIDIEDPYHHAAGPTPEEEKQRHQSFNDFAHMKALEFGDLADEDSLDRFTFRTRKTGRTMFSTRAFHERPLDSVHIVHLHDIIKRDKTREDELYEMNKQVYGFDMNHWVKQNKELNPVSFIRGEKQHFGNYINASHARRRFVFTVKRKSTSMQRQAVLQYIETRLPNISIITTRVKRKNKYDIVKEVRSVYDLRNLIDRELKMRATVLIKLTW